MRADAGRAARRHAGGMTFPVETQGLTKRYGDLIAVDGVSLTVRPGEVYGFLGPNGAGKTTTLWMLLGLIRPTAGTVRLLGQPPGRKSGLARVGLGLVWLLAVQNLLARGERCQGGHL